MTTEQIVALAGKYATILFGALGGTAGIVTLVKKGMDVIVRRKPIKLDASDKKEIAEQQAALVADMLKNGVSVDMSAQLDAATNKRLSEMEKKQNQLIDTLQKSKKRDKLLMSAIAEFKTITPEQRAALLTEVAQDDDIPALTDVPQVTTFIEKVKEKISKPKEQY